MVTVYIPIEELEAISNGNKPKNYWLHIPDSWDKKSMMSVQISLETLNEWRQGKDTRILLKD